MNRLVVSLVLLSAIAATAAQAGAATGAPVAVTTYHYDTFRTGWNRHEGTLSAASFPATFGVIATAALDDQVDAQPLIVPAQTINGSTHDVVYVATENNTVYAIDGNSGEILLQQNLGPPVPSPLACTFNGPNVGINSTPVVDIARGTIYVMAYVNGSDGAPPSYWLHALSLTTLEETLAPVKVAASTTLTNGTTFLFDATYERQRPALLELNGIIYAGFGSFCDYAGNESRGWVLGWHADSLARLVHVELNDTQGTSPTDFFLSSVWMAGFGIAGHGNRIFFSTGNSDCNIDLISELCPQKSTYDGITNIQESVVGMSADLGARTGVFTPENVLAMDAADEDLGSGGVMLMPAQSDGYELAVITGKDGRLILLDQNNLPAALDLHQLEDGCWCGPSYFAADGVNRIVSSAGNALQTWLVEPSPSPHLVKEATAHVRRSYQDPGFFTAISSNGTQGSSAIIWTVERPGGSGSSNLLRLDAFAALPTNSTFKHLYDSSAGSWDSQGDANVVPVVANGKVYVASHQLLTIFGVNGTVAPKSARGRETIAHPLPPGMSNRVSGILLSMDGATLTLRTRTGHLVKVNGDVAITNRRTGILVIGNSYTALSSGTSADGTQQGVAIARAKRSTKAWPPDQ